MNAANRTGSGPPAEQRLRGAYWEMLHNASLFSPIYGDVGIYEGLPFYSDGQQLIVVGYGIEDCDISAAARGSALVARTLREAPDELQFVEFWGPEVPRDLDTGPEFARSHAQAPSVSNRDVLLSLRGMTHLDVRSRRDVRRAVRKGLHVSICSAKEITPAHLAVFTKFTNKHSDIDFEEKKYVFCWQKALHAHDSILFNVHNENRQLTGFAILSVFGTRVATYAYGFFDNQTAGTSDLAHAAMIEYCIGRYEWLDLGYSIHEQLLRYKLKWGITRLLESPWCVRWRRITPRPAPI